MKTRLRLFIAVLPILVGGCANHPDGPSREMMETSRDLKFLREEDLHLTGEEPESESSRPIPMRSSGEDKGWQVDEAPGGRKILQLR